MRSVVTAFAIIPLLLTACGDDPVKPGALDVKWEHPQPATCGTRFVTQLEARALKGTEVVATSGKQPCPASDRTGTIPLSDLDPGTYRIEVEGFDQGGNGTYLGFIAKQTVKAGTTTTTTSVTLGQKPASISIEWTLPGGKQCAQAGIAKMKVDVIFDATQGSNPAGTQTVDCTAGEVVFPDLEPNDDVAIFLTGLDEDDNAVAQASIQGENLVAGEEFEQTVALEACPGDPPDCP